MTVDGSNAAINATGFTGKLNVGINTLQLLANKVDQLTFTGAEMAISTASFNKNLTAADDTVQKALNTLDDLVTGASTVNATAFT